MRKYTLRFYSILFIFFISCHSAPSPTKELGAKEEKVEVFPVTDFLLGQINEIEKMPVTLLKVVSQNGKVDSQWVSRDSIRYFSKPFLSPVIDSVNFGKNYSAHSFLDQTVDAFTFTYDAIKVSADSFPITHLDVYVDPQSRKVKRLYMIKEKIMEGKNNMQQLTWNTEDGFLIRNILSGKSDSIPDIKEVSVKWKF
ncbi:MAG: hypothetical protein JSS98_01700 [Bacteroidetes bacterium]|nr:hypothetical protein [Bacteroidota bacterium]